MHSYWISLSNVLLESGLFLLLGFAIAGILHVTVPVSLLTRHLQSNGWRSTLKAILIGAPIPLCSCSVLPVAQAMRNGGAGRGPVTGFLVSAPETSVDTVIYSWALLGPVWAIARPVAAIVSAFFAGILQPKDEKVVATRQPLVMVESCCCDSCHSTHEAPRNWKTGVRYALLEMPTDLARYLIPGLLIAALIGAIVPENLFSSYTSGVAGYLVAIGIGVPLYVCASSSIPLAASLLAAGVAPGPILAFLLVGPATNVAAFGVVRNLLGNRGFVIQLVVIIVVAVFAGLTLDWVYATYSIETRHVGGEQTETFGVWYIIGAIVLSGLLLNGLYRDYKGKR